MGCSPNTFDIEAYDLLAVIDSIGGRAHVVGGSYGATVALHAAAKSADHIASIALFEPPLLMSGPHLAPVLDEYRNLCAAGHFGAALQLFLRMVARIPAEIIAGGDPVPDDPASARALLGDLEAMANDSDDTGRWAPIQVPTLLMQGGRSWPPLPEGMDLLASAIPHATRIVWADQSHFATTEAPDRVAAAIQRFVDSHS